MKRVAMLGLWILEVNKILSRYIELKRVGMKKKKDFFFIKQRSTNMTQKEREELKTIISIEKQTICER